MIRIDRYWMLGSLPRLDVVVAGLFPTFQPTSCRLMGVRGGNKTPRSCPPECPVKRISVLEAPVLLAFIERSDADSPQQRFKRSIYFLQLIEQWGSFRL